MKSSIAAMIALATLVGCTQGTPGGPGTTDASSTKPVYGQADDTFNLSVPMMSSPIQQGEQMAATVGIKRAKNFSEDVTLTFADLPKGVTVEPAKPTIQHGDSEAKFTFTATDAASMGDFKVKVTGHPTKGGDAQGEFKLTVAPKDSFAITTPLLSTSLTQGESKTVTMAISRDKTFDQDVALSFGDLPQGVTLTPETAVIKRGELETLVTLSGTDDAAIGNFTIKVTGHPAKGVDASNDFSFTVVKK